MLLKKEKSHYLYDSNYEDKKSQSKKKKSPQYATTIERIVKINNVVNTKNYDDNDWTFKDEIITLKMCQKILIKESNDEERQLQYELIIFR